MVLWRHGMRSDIAMCHWMNGRPLAFPPIPREQERLHRGWMESYARGSIKEDALEWAAASFSLECFLHRACHVANNFIKFRVDGRFPPEIAEQFESVKQSLIAEHSEWPQRSVIQKAFAEELLLTSITSVSNPQFLDYPPAPPITNPLFIFLRNIWYGSYIYISLLGYEPNVPRPSDRLRISYAVEICRAYAVTGFQNFPGFDYYSVVMAAVAFAESEEYEKESEWIYKRVVFGNGPAICWPAIEKLFIRMGELWGKQYFEWEDVLPEYGVLRD